MRNALAIVTLALGVGASTAIFSFLNPLLLHPLRYAQPERLVTIQARDPKGNAASSSYPDFREWSERRARIGEMAAFDVGFFDLTGVNEPEEIPGALVTSNLFRMLGVAPALGRGFRDGEEGVVILSDGAWRRRFGVDRSILGRSIALDFARTPQVERFTVIGVMPPDFWMYYGNFEVFVPLARGVIREDRHARLLTVIGRLAAGATPAQAESSLAAIPAEKGWGVQVRSWEEEVRRPVRAQMLALAGGAGLLLAIACANVAGLLLVRAHARRREMAIRAALGASPGRLLRLFLEDALGWGAMAALGGIGLAYACVKTMTALLPPDIELTRLLPGMGRVAIDPAALGFAAGVAMLACLAAATVPAMRVRRADPVEGLKGASRVESHRGRAVLVSVEVALAVTLLASAGLLEKTLERIRSIDLGFQPEHMLFLRVPPPRANANASYYDELSRRVNGIPGVESAALASSITGRTRDGLEIPSRSEKFSASELVVEPKYFTTMRIRLRAGRFFEDTDRRRVVINETMARRYWPDGDALGDSIRMGGQAYEITGIAADTRPQPFRDPVPMVYRTARDADARAAQMVVRAAGDPLAIARAVASVVRDLGGVVAETGTADHFIENQTWQQEQAAALMGAFAALALALSAVGLYGVISFAIARRTREIGIRVALGAHRADVIGLVLVETARPALAGVAVGIAGALAAGRMLAALLYHVAPRDPGVIAMVAAVTLVTACLAAVWPLRRALSIAPHIALRDE